MTINQIVTDLESEPLFDEEGGPIAQGLRRLGWALSHWNGEPSAGHFALLDRVRLGITRANAKEVYGLMSWGIGIVHPSFSWLRPAESEFTDAPGSMGYRIRELVRGQGWDFDGQAVVHRRSLTQRGRREQRFGHAA